MCVCFRWKRNGQKEIVKDVTTLLPVLQFVAIQRRDTKEWAIPGVSKAFVCYLRTIHAPAARVVANRGMQ